MAGGFGELGRGTALFQRSTQRRVGRQDSLAFRGVGLVRNFDRDVAARHLHDGRLAGYGDPRGWRTDRTSN
jgi:hypothetical protein